ARLPLFERRRSPRSARSRDPRRAPGRAGRSVVAPAPVARVAARGRLLSGSLAVLALLGGWLAADATAFLQLLVSQPLVGGALSGWILGDAFAGAQVGALLQLFALAGLPLGGRTPEDFASAGVVGPVVALTVQRDLPT